MCGEIAPPFASPSDLPHIRAGRLALLSVTGITCLRASFCGQPVLACYLRRGKIDGAMRHGSDQASGGAHASSVARCEVRCVRGLGILPITADSLA